MRISTKGRGIIRAQQGAVARPNPKENYKLPEDQRYQAQTRGMKDFAIEWYKERAKQPKYQSQVNESNLANITDQINRAEYVEPSKFYSNPNVYKGKVGNVTVDADSVTNNAVCQSGVTTEIPINQAYIGGDTANISINVII